MAQPSGRKVSHHLRDEIRVGTHREVLQIKACTPLGFPQFYERFWNRQSLMSLIVSIFCFWDTLFLTDVGNLLQKPLMPCVILPQCMWGWADGLRSGFSCCMRTWCCSAAGLLMVRCPSSRACIFSLCMEAVLRLCLIRWQGDNTSHLTGGCRLSSRCLGTELRREMLTSSSHPQPTAVPWALCLLLQQEEFPWILTRPFSSLEQLRTRSPALLAVNPLIKFTFNYRNFLTVGKLTTKWESSLGINGK